VTADETPAELAELRGYYHNAVERAVISVREKYEQELKALDKKLVEKGKIEEALAVKRELAALSGQLVILDGRYASGMKKKDVTETLREKVTENRLVIPGGDGTYNELFGNPHRGTEDKYLRIRYRIGDRTRTVFARKDEAVSIPEEDLKIVSASYGSEENREEVTDILQEMVRSGRLHIPGGKASYNALFKNPDRGIHEKHLTITYKLGGRAETVRFDMNEPLTIPPSSPQQSAR
jgi:hypothetical protein